MQSFSAYILSVFVSCLLLYGTLANGNACFSEGTSENAAVHHQPNSALDEEPLAPSGAESVWSMEGEHFSEAVLSETFLRTNVIPPRIGVRPVSTIACPIGETAVRLSESRRRDTMIGGVSAGFSRSSRPLWIAVHSLLI